MEIPPATDTPPLGSPPPPPPIPDAPAVIAGFWRRVVGSFIDGLLPACVGFLLGVVFFDEFVRLNGWGRLIGFAIALVYFVPMNSHLANGSTIGKRVVGTKVVTSDGQPIGLGRSLVRFVILSVPFFLNGAPIPPSLLLTSWIGVADSFAFFGIGGAITYLIIFNRRTRQSLHDLVVGSFVIKRSTGESPVTVRMWRGHWIVVLVIFALSVAVPLAMKPLANNDFFRPLLALQSRLLNEPELSSVLINEGTFRTFGTVSSSKSILNVAVHLREKGPQFEAEADKVAEIVLREYPRAHEKDQINIVIVYGFDLGIARLSTTKIFPRSPADWQNRMGSKGE